MSLLKKILLFIAGLLSPFLIVGSVLFIYLPKSNSSLKPVFLYNMKSNISDKDLSFQIKDTNLKLYKVSDFDEDVLFINFWATWCVPCIAEMPSIELLKNNFKGKNIRFIFITNEDIDKVIKFKQKKTFNLDFYTVVNHQLPDKFKTNTIPYTLILHKKKIVYEHLGSQNWNDPFFHDFLKSYL